MTLTRTEIKTLWEDWNAAWDAHDLDRVMTFFHEEIYFNNWTGGYAEGKAQLKKAWQDWFSNHGHFKFTQEDVFIDVEAQKLLFRWELSWPSFEPGYEGQPEKRRGVDVIHFKDGKIISKLTYCKTTLEIGGSRVRLTP